LPPEIPPDLAGRHASTREKLGWLVPNPNLPAGTPGAVASLLWQAGLNLAGLLKDGPQLTLGLQHLIDAKDCAVRQGIADGTG
jgi:hypothetical protein